MNIHAIGPIAVSRAPSSGESAVDNATPTKPSSAAQPAVNAMERASVTFSSPLSPKMKALLTNATQEIEPQGGNAGKIPPAQQARAAILANPELADQPFGALVSRIARGESLEFNSTPDADTETTDDVVEVPQEPLPVPPATDNPSPEVPVVIADGPTNSLAVEPASPDLLKPPPILADTVTLLSELIPDEL